MPMPAGAAVGNLLLALVVMRPSGTVPSGGFNNDALSVTGSGTWSLLTDQSMSSFGGHAAIYGKHCTGGEGDLKALMTAVEAGGNGAGLGVVLEFANVKFTGDTSYFESLAATNLGSVSGRLFDQDLAAVGGNRLCVNFLLPVNAAGTFASGLPTGETSGKWTQRYTVTSTFPRVAVWTSTDQTVGGGGVTSSPAGGNPFTAIGFALAPCEPAVTPARKFHHYLMLMGA